MIKAPKKEPQNITSIWESMTPEEKDMLLRAVIKDGKYPNPSMATLPFLTADYVRSVLIAHAEPDKPDRARAAADSLMLRLQHGFEVFLDQNKVAKRMGSDPTLRFRLPGTTMKVIAGLAWSLPKKAYVPTTADVLPVIEMKRTGKNKYMVNVPHIYRDQAMTYLVANFSI